MLFRPTENGFMPFVSIDHQDLRRLAAGVFTAAGSGPDEARIVADHLVEANLRGHDSHGVGLIPMYMADRLAGHLHPNLHAKLVRDDGPFGVFDGGMGYGHVLAREATEWGITRAHESGMAILALRRSYHLARLGTYGEMAAAGLVAILFVNVVAGRQKVAPFAGSDGRMLKVVDEDTATGRQQRTRHIGPDEAGAAGHQHRTLRPHSPHPLDSR
jgi:uncharacterized oxidoreductase